MNDMATPITELLEKFLDVTSSRQKLIVSNMANVDTPGYQTKDLDFRGELDRAMQGGDPLFTPVARSVHGLLERPDGNNVSLDRESLLLAESQMQFGLATQLVKHEFHRLLAAIQGGTGGGQ
jgi:flagellar basal-body rod protein FlgB